eukprot:TRINITY_DN5990_c0_g2_i1.p2 TRINITY_DN5990_c0_g2~~TRINITY_DN5990_c0_g2_i1.p2  ORF type:complete len:255 (+),score=44.17 TRINITY_DN5990_c0_g2_i1:105-767(+)
MDSDAHTRGRSGSDRKVPGCTQCRSSEAWEDKLGGQEHKRRRALVHGRDVSLPCSANCYVVPREQWNMPQQGARQDQPEAFAAALKEAEIKNGGSFLRERDGQEVQEGEGEQERQQLQLEDADQDESLVQVFTEILQSSSECEAYLHRLWHLTEASFPAWQAVGVLYHAAGATEKGSPAGTAGVSSSTPASSGCASCRWEDTSSRARLQETNEAQKGDRV